MNHVSMDSRPDMKRDERERLAAATEAFLRGGGEIRQFGSGVFAETRPHLSYGSDGDGRVERARSRGVAVAGRLSGKGAA